MRAIIATISVVLVAASVPAHADWGIVCGDNRLDAILDDFDMSWASCCTPHASIPHPGVSTVAGCRGNALAITYDLRNVAPPGSPTAGQSWVVVVKTLPAPVDLTRYTHLRVAMRGSNPNSHEKVEVKLKDQAGRLFSISLNSLTDLPVWRPILIDVRELGGDGTLDLAHITGLEIGITRCTFCEVWDNPRAGGPPDEHTGTLFLDEFAVVDFSVGASQRLVQTQFASLIPNVPVAASAANGLRARLVAAPSGVWIPAWFPEETPNFNSYAQAEALLVLLYESERTGDVSFRTAARDLASRLIALQIRPERRQHGAWFTAYNADGTGSGCSGDESAVPDVDRCQWVGNVGWMVIALSRLQRSGFYPDGAALQSAITRAADWIARQPGERGNTTYPGLISLGIEGNISAYFGLRAAGRRAQAFLLGKAIHTFGWDATLHRMKVGVSPLDYVTALDVAGSWGATFLRAIGRWREALESQGYTSSVLRTSSFDGLHNGPGDIGGPYTPSVEFVAQAASARIADADYMLQQMLPLQQADGVFKGAYDHWYGGALNPWVTTMTGVSPTAWMYFALTLKDPLLDLAPPFTDDPIAPGVTTVRAVHVTEIRTRINTLRRKLPPLGDYSWANNTLGTGSIISARDIEDLRTALDECYKAVQLTPPTYTDQPLTPATLVREVHMREVRAALIQIE